jgi:anti-sigma-K factor RskA
MNDHDALRDAAGAWVLGALSEEEAYGFQAHLEVCASCRDEVGRLRVAADALPLAVPHAAPPPELKTRLMAIVEAEAEASAAAPKPRRTPFWERARGLMVRPAFAAAAAALLLVVGGVTGFAVRGGDDALSRVIPMTADGAKARGAQARIVQTGQGVEVRVSDMPAPPPGRVYQVWLQRDGDAPTPDAVFTVDRDGRGSVAVLGKTSGSDAVLVTDEPLGGSTVPSRQPVLRGRLA